MSAAAHAFDAAVALDPGEDGTWQGRTHAAWANMIGTYGGITAAQMLQSVLLHPQLLGEPVALTVNFAAAVAQGGFTLRPRSARTNRSTQHWTVELLQGDAVVATSTAVTAVRRATWGMQEAAAPVAPRPADTPRTLRRGTEWVQRYDLRYLEGDVPRSWDGQDSGTSLSRLWVRDDPPRPLDFASLTALADVFFPRLWLRRARLAPLGTVSMTVYFHASGEQLRGTGDGWLLGQAQGHGFGRNFLDQSGLLWNEAGELLATTHHVMYNKE